ncbi:MerR family transcriptional regulator [Bacillus sp. FJAT-42376]|uniref:MerR family transcriptional regulator n=1 Tax=Bacillus sp. FJAT-42376 TaxID=2014076 RepID=UPI000F4EFAE4|nr:MerR family transcriptional regulator [Bacillus sp. FJAT-42376]AZB44000.1 MerR family transcriptional regulator [Bacillus sp. FJAT-42376]
MFTISEAAKALEISTHTLRYYEKEGIIEPERKSNGDRIYSDLHIKWLQFVLKLKETQMPVAKIKEYAQLYKKGDHTNSARLQLLEEHRRSIQEQLAVLSATDQLLEDKIEAYKKSHH